MPRPTTSALATRRMLDGILQQIKSTGFVNVEENREAGTIRVVDDNGEIPINAISKGPHGPWIVTYYNTARFTWAKREATDVPSDSNTTKASDAAPAPG